MQKVNILINNGFLELKVGNNYIVIDALYINDIKEQISDLNEFNFLEEIKEKVFIYCNTPFVKYSPEKKFFTMNQIVKFFDETTDSDNKCVFSTDTGLVLFIEEKFIKEFIQLFNYDYLVDEKDDLLNLEYWNSIISNYEFNSFGIVVAPGINSGYDFGGSGRYYLI
jgi:hypothetical protein